MVNKAFRDAANGYVTRLKLEGCILLQDVRICKMSCRVSPALLRELHQRPSVVPKPNFPWGRVWLPDCRCKGGLKLGEACYFPGFLRHIIEATIYNFSGCFEKDIQALRSMDVCTDSSCEVPRPALLENALAHMPNLTQLKLKDGVTLCPSLIRHLTSLKSLEVKDSVRHDGLAALAGVCPLEALSLSHTLKEGKSTEHSKNHFARPIQVIGSPAFSHLRMLGVCPFTEDLHRLSVLTSLRELYLTLHGFEEPRLESLAALTGLKELYISNTKLDRLWNHFTASCPFLGALTGLTSLGLCCVDDLFDDTSELIALTVLSCPAFNI